MTRHPAGGRVQAADLASKRKPPMVSDVVRAEAILALPVARMPAAEEAPVDARQVNGRPTRPWEAGEMVEARHRERRAEMRLFDGIGP